MENKVNVRTLFTQPKSVSDMLVDGFDSFPKETTITLSEAELERYHELMRGAKDSSMADYLGDCPNIELSVGKAFINRGKMMVGAYTDKYHLESCKDIKQKITQPIISFEDEMPEELIRAVGVKNRDGDCIDTAAVSIPDVQWVGPLDSAPNNDGSVWAIKGLEADFDPCSLLETDYDNGDEAAIGLAGDYDKCEDEFEEIPWTRNRGAGITRKSNEKDKAARQRIKKRRKQARNRRRK